jgi:phage shock protein PspC (stress-responsive transcriptional regulator)
MTNTVQETPKKLQRIHEGRMLGGVCAGWARYLGVDVAVVRVMVVVATFVFVGTTIPLYAACYVLTPNEETPGQPS